MKSNYLLIAGIMLIILGIIMGLEDSQICFIPIVLGIICLLYAIQIHHLEEIEKDHLQGPRYRRP